MGLSGAAYARQLKALLPSGAAWNLEPTSWLSKLMLGIADELARLDARGDVVIDETDPRTTLELLEDWERVLGLPDACVTGDQSIEQRRSAVVAKVIAIGGQTPAYFIAVAAALGFTVTITEFRPATVVSKVNDPITGSAWAYTWQVNATLGDSGVFHVTSSVDEPLTWWASTPVECILRRLKPSHTQLIFAYA